MNLSTLGACPTFFKNMNLSHTPAQELEDRYTNVCLPNTFQEQELIAHTGTGAGGQVH